MSKKKKEECNVFCELCGEMFDDELHARLKDFKYCPFCGRKIKMCEAESGEEMKKKLTFNEKYHSYFLGNLFIPMEP